MKTRSLIKLSLLAFFLFLSAWLYLTQQKSQISTTVDSASAVAPLPNQQTALISEQQNQNSTKDDTELLRQLKHQLQIETARVGETNKDPAGTERELERWANSLTESELKSLKKNTLDSTVDADERSLSIYLLSLNQSVQALQPLQDVALSPLPATQNDRSLLFEEVLRAQAIEGLLRQENKTEVHQTMQALAQRTDSNFLNDQARRSLAYLNGEASHPTEQSHKALQKLLNKTRSQQ